MKRVFMSFLSLMLALPKNLPPAERVHLEQPRRRSRGPSDGKFQELLREARIYCLERPAKFANPEDRRAGITREEWRRARNKRKAAAQKLRGKS